MIRRILQTLVLAIVAYCSGVMAFGWTSLAYFGERVAPVLFWDEQWRVYMREMPVFSAILVAITSLQMYRVLSQLDRHGAASFADEMTYLADVGLHAQEYEDNDDPTNIDFLLRERTVRRVDTAGPEPAVEGPIFFMGFSVGFCLCHLVLVLQLLYFGSRAWLGGTEIIFTTWKTR